MVFGSRGQISAAFPGTHGCVRAPNDTVYVFNSTDGKGLDGWLGAGPNFFETFQTGGHSRRLGSNLANETTQGDLFKPGMQKTTK